MQRQSFESVNPSTGEIIARYPRMSPAELERAIEACRQAQIRWRRYGVPERIERFTEAARCLEQRKERYARLMAFEMGKVIHEGIAEIEKCAWGFRYYAEHGESWLAPETVATEAHRSRVEYLPLGLVLAVMPWNFPFWQVFRFGITALLAGNGILLKHAPGVFGCALELAELIRDAGFPEGLVTPLLIDTPEVAGLIADPRIAAVTLTGSVAAGRSVAAAAGGALKKCVLELGGSDPFILLEDADLENAADGAIASRFQNCGQSCIAAKRFIVLEAVREAFLDKLLERVRRLRVGNPLANNVDLGPMARHDLRERLHDQVRDSVERGARLLLGGIVPDGPGAFYPPTVLAEVKPQMAAWSEELFGPVAVVIAVRDEAEAIEVANSTAFGLAASVWTGDAVRGESLAGRMESGACFVNAVPKSDPRLPFGGVKQSGYGRELSVFGVREFVNVRTVWVEAQ